LDAIEGRDAAIQQIAASAAANRIEACPPSSPEALSVPFYAVRTWLSGAREPDIADVEGRSIDSGPVEPSETRRPVLANTKEGWVVISSDQIRPGQTIVVPTTYGGLSRGTWDPTSAAPVPDLGTQARRLQSGRTVLRLHPGLFDLPLIPPDPRDFEEDSRSDLQLLRDWLQQATELSLDSGLSPLLGELLRDKRMSFVYLDAYDFIERETGKDNTAPGYFVLAGRVSAGGDITSEDDGASFTGTSVPLRSHLSGVSSRAREYARRCGLPREVVEDISTAALWHDAGKVDPRFQQFLHGGSEFLAATAAEPLAKSKTDASDRRARLLARDLSGYPSGSRHELSSLALIQKYAGSGSEKIGHDPDLVMHLVSAHHGFCRPFPPVATDPSPVEMRFEAPALGAAVATTSDHGLDRLDSGIADRFWRLVERYGWYGLAWMEAILRLADHRQSEAEQSGKGENP
jgi:CRISPR-associated endonuclease/helicase Cas3